jgi:hypothetical protein
MTAREAIIHHCSNHLDYTTLNKWIKFQSIKFYLFNDGFQYIRLHSVEWKDEKWMMNRKDMEGSGRGLI